MLYIAYVIIGIALIVILGKFYIWLTNNILKNIHTPLFINILAFLGFFFSIVYILNNHNFFKRKYVLSFIESTKSTLQVFLLGIIIVVIAYIMIGFFGKRYTLRVDNFNIGGINVFFDKSNEVYIKTVGTFIGSKRTIFYFYKTRDSISQVLDAYYEVYKFIRSNIELLDSEKDAEIYEVSVNILIMLNNFLTKHQNDYRRWFNKVLADDKIVLEDSTEIIVHSTTIEDVQKHYYRYEEVIEDIAKINEYMKSSNIKEIFLIKFFDWEGK